MKQKIQIELAGAILKRAQRLAFCEAYESVDEFVEALIRRRWEEKPPVLGLDGKALPVSLPTKDAQPCPQPLPEQQAA